MPYLLQNSRKLSSERGKTRIENLGLLKEVAIDLPQRRFGLVALEKGFIKADHLYEALMRQKAQETGGAERRPLGLLLKDLGHLSVAQINEILETLQQEAVSRRPTPRASR